MLNDGLQDGESQKSFLVLTVFIRYRGVVRLSKPAVTVNIDEANEFEGVNP
jgi:hypothetical protein